MKIINNPNNDEIYQKMVEMVRGRRLTELKVLTGEIMKGGKLWNLRDTEYKQTIEYLLIMYLEETVAIEFIDYLIKNGMRTFPKDCFG